MRTFGNGLRAAWRALVKNPGFSLVALLTLALGIGTNTAVFSVAYAVLWRPMPFGNAPRLVTLRSISRGRTISLSYPDAVDARALDRVFEAVAVYTGQAGILSGGIEPLRVSQELVSPNYFSVVGVPPDRGRDFRPTDDTPGAPPVTIVSHELWQSRFGSDPRILGRSLTINDVPTTVVGVMRPRFPAIDGDPVDVWTPIGPWAAVHREDLAAREHRPGIFALGLGRRGISVVRIQRDLDVFGARLRRQYRESNAAIGFRADPLREFVVASIRPALVGLLAAVGFLLLIVCSNVANLLLARASARRREIAIRAAIGATRAQIAGQLLCEGLLLSMAGGLAGVLAAWGALRILAARGGSFLPSTAELRVDGAALGFTLALVIVTTLLFGLVPAFRASRTDLRRALSSGAPQSGRTDGQHWRPVLVAGEIALSFVLVTGAGLLVRSFQHLLRVDPGLDPAHVLTAQITLRESRYRMPPKRLAFYRELLERLRRTPGIEAAGLTNPLPFTGKGMQFQFMIEGRPAPGRGEAPSSDSTVIDAGLPAALHIPLIAGRHFSESDDLSAPRVALVNSEMARRFWPGGGAIGARFSTEDVPNASGNSWMTIVGVVGDVKQYGLDREQNTVIYLPVTQMPLRTATVVLRGRGAPEELGKALWQTVREIDAEQPVHSVRTMQGLIDDSYARRRLTMWLFTLFAALAVVFAAVGLSGVIFYLVVGQTREIGVRMALGARPANIVSLILRQGSRPVVAGLAVGTAASLFATRALRSALFGVGPTDALTFVVAGVGLLAIALAASLVPAVRATRIEPTVALRTD